MKEIIGYLVFQTEILDGLTLWHCFRLVADEQPFKIIAAVHTFNIFCYSSEGHIFYYLEQYVKIGRLQTITYTICLPILLIDFYSIPYLSNKVNLAISKYDSLITNALYILHIMTYK